MPLITETIREALLKNGKMQKENIRKGKPELDLKRVVKLFRLGGPCRWLLTELDPDDHDLAFGLCDLGLGSAELGHVRISEIEACSLPPIQPMLRDGFFQANRTISEFAELAAREGRIRAWYPEPIADE